MLGDAILIAKGIESTDHLAPITELTLLSIKTERSLRVIDNLRRLRHNINYYGYSPSIEEATEARSIAMSLFNPVKEEVLRIIQ